LRLRRDAGCDDNSSAEQIAAPARVVFLDRLAGVEADTNADIAVPDRPLDSDGALERPRRGAERGHETVAHRLDLASPVRLQRLTRDPLVFAQHIARCGVAQTVRKRG